MALFGFPPSPVLREYILEYRLVDFIFDDAASIPCKPYAPRPQQCLSFYPKDTETVEYAASGKKITGQSAVLTGQQNELTYRYVGKNFLAFQVVFKPGALYRITGIPSPLLTNCYIDAETTFPNYEIREVTERLSETNSYQTMVQIVEEFLHRQVARCKKEFHYIDYTSNLILQATEDLTIEWLAKESCLSLRQYQRKFKERMGVSPKFFTKVARFENAFRMKNKFPHLDWLTIAIHCGYYDYQHLAKDYKALTMQYPTEFHLLDLLSPERKFGVADTY